MAEKKLLVIVNDPGKRMKDPDFLEEEIYYGIDLTPYSEYKWVEAYGDEVYRLNRKYVKNGWTVKRNTLFS